jgi:hypothetical protein
MARCGKPHKRRVSFVRKEIIMKKYTFNNNTTTVTEAEVCKAYEIVTGKSITEVTPEILNECKGLDAEINPVIKDNITMISATSADKMTKQWQEKVHQYNREKAQKFCDRLSKEIAEEATIGGTYLTVNTLPLDRDVIEVVMQTIKDNGFTITHLNGSNFVINW